MSTQQEEVSAQRELFKTQSASENQVSLYTVVAYKLVCVDWYIFFLNKCAAHYSFNL